MTIDLGQRMRCPGEVHPADSVRCLFYWRGALDQGASMHPEVPERLAGNRIPAILDE